jgi:hypothetical protein
MSDEKEKEKNAGYGHHHLTSNRSLEIMRKMAQSQSPLLMANSIASVSDGCGPRVFHKGIKDHSKCNGNSAFRQPIGQRTGPISIHTPAAAKAVRQAHPPWSNAINWTGLELQNGIATSGLPLAGL